MVSRCRCKKIIFFAFIVWAACLTGCSNSTSTTTVDKKLVFENGDLLFRRGTGFFSPYFARFASKEQKFSHVGILFRDADSVYVYHIEANELTGVGSVRKEPLSVFLKDVKQFDVKNLNLSSENRKTVIRKADSLFQKQAPFDMDFDLNTHDSFYCTEFVAYILNTSLNDTVIVPSLKMNGKKFYSIDDLYHCRLVKE